MKLICKQFALSLLLAMMSITMAQATPVGKQVTGTIALQGGSNSAVKYMAPSTAPYKVHVLVPKTGKTTNALYRVYPKGKRAGSTNCLSSDATFPCYEITVDQTQHQNAWVQLVLDNDAATQWDFVKGKGYVTALAGNLSAVEMLNLSAVVRFVATTAPILRWGVVPEAAQFDAAFIDSLTPLAAGVGITENALPGANWISLPAHPSGTDFFYYAIPAANGTTGTTGTTRVSNSMNALPGLVGSLNQQNIPGNSGSDGSPVMGSDGVAYNIFAFSNPVRLAIIAYINVQ
ncbi:MAG: hypothetical protein Q8N96_15125 [Methylovulum sp.]|nr:hypothetical protein [Methylovulum sp.]